MHCGKKKKKKLEEEKKKMATNECYQVTCTAPVTWPWQSPITFASSVPTVACNQKQEEVTMNTFEQDTRDYLTKRVNFTFRSLEQNIYTQFNFYKPHQPRTYKELIDAIKNGEYTIDEKIAARCDDEDSDDYMCGDCLFGPINFTKFPKADEDGRAKAQKELDVLKTATMDTVMTETSAEALAAIKTLEAWVPSNLPS